MTDGDSNDTEDCPKCIREVPELIDVSDSDGFDHDEVCGWCIRKHGQSVAREGERGQGQRPIGEQHAVNRHTRYPSSEEVDRTLQTATEQTEDS